MPDPSEFATSEVLSHEDSRATSIARRRLLLGVASTSALGLLPGKFFIAHAAPAALTMPVGHAQYLAADAYTRVSPAATGTYTSANPSVATVDDYGQIHALAPGATTITDRTSGAAVTTAVTVVAVGAPRAAFYLSTQGNDANSGLSADQPVKTLPRAQALARAALAQMDSGALAVGAVEVRMAPGRYEIAQPLLLDTRDRGRGGYPMVWCKSPSTAAGEVVISGGRTIGGWKQVDPPRMCGQHP